MKPPTIATLFLLGLGGATATAQTAEAEATAPATDRIALAVSAGAQFLRGIQRQDGAIGDQANPLFETWETVAAATALLDAGSDPAEPALAQALAYLRANENANGLLCHNRRCREGYCLETTAEYVGLLARLPGAPELAKRVAGVVALQRQGGEWQIGNPDVREDTDFPSVTAFVLTMLDAAGTKPRHKSRAWSWLLDRQSSQGDWGASWEYYGTPAYALWPVLRALETRDSSAVRAARARAVAFIESSQRPDGSWSLSDPTRPKGPSAELETTLMLSALRHAARTADRNVDRKADRNSGRETMRRGVDFLLARQRPDGSWDGGYFPIDSARYEKKEHVFATARAISILAWWRGQAAD